MLQIKNLMKEKYVPEDRMELLVGLIYKRLKDYAFDLISDGKAVDVSFDKQFALFSKYFLYAKSNFNPLNRMRSSHAILQVNPKEQVFIRQLTDIDCISESKFMDLMHVLLNFQQYIEQGLIEGAIIPEEVDELDKNAELIWGAIFQNAYDEIERRRRLAQSVDEKEIDAIARKIYHQIQGQHISQESFPLDNRLSFGEFLKLSDQPKIGWHIDWEMRYAK
ncbi:MAG: hypothetical protein CVV47_13660 [Spirochaetae bacterium HGW-Spirochaetae-3]|nr:MAG: hypothetical protein CVV47_13660 [Spirochaetae bacterium HGW-Spirochaetae-3]